jgi:hypothetical protein
VSNCAALASASAVDTRELDSRLVLMAVFAVLYLTFAILFGVRLSNWDDKIPGRCYDTSHLALHNAQHPYVDRIYLGVTCLYMFAVLGFALGLALARCEVDQRKDLMRSIILICRIYSRIVKTISSGPLGNWADADDLESQIWYMFGIPVKLAQANPVLQISMLQLPLHLYFIIRIRLSNEPLLSNGSDENRWGFGQIYVLVISAGPVIECFKGYLSTCTYLTFQRPSAYAMIKDIAASVKTRRLLRKKMEIFLDLLRKAIDMAMLLTYHSGAETCQGRFMCIPKLLPSDNEFFGLCFGNPYPRVFELDQLRSCRE